MNVKTSAGELGERRARFALSRSTRPLVGHRGVSDFAALTKPRVMMLAVFTALVGLSSAPVRLDPLTTLAAVIAIAAGAGAAGVAQHVVRRRYRCDHEPHRDAAYSPRQGIPVRSSSLWTRAQRFRSSSSGVGDEPHSSRVVGRHDSVLCCRVHGVAEADHATEHRHRRRCRSTTARDRMGGCNWRSRDSSRWRCSSLSSFGRHRIFGRLALNRTDDYARAGVPMLPVVAGRPATTRQILIYSCLLASGLGGYPGRWGLLAPCMARPPRFAGRFSFCSHSG